MKRNLLSMIIALFVFVSGYSQKTPEQTAKKTKSNKEIVAANGNITKKQVKELQKKHAKHVANNPFKKTFLMSKTQRKAEGLPPNKYYEQEWIQTMNPAIGRPTPENLGIIRNEILRKRKEAIDNRIPGDGTDNLWQERGPNNVGGRTKAMIFDPTDPTGNTVIAGGVSGGLWKNTNITSAATAWTRITSLPEHLNVQNITVDPNNSSIWYVGTGESYTQGDANGNGIWKTTNAGTTWTRVFGGGTVSSTQSYSYNLFLASPSNSALLNPGNTPKGYVTALASFGNPVTSLGGNKQIVLVNDGTAGNNATTGYPLSTEGCAASTPGIFNNKIALIRRGTCTFEAKALEAQNAGAVGVIIMNNQAGGAVGMASSSLGATVPTVMISKEDGDLLVANLTNLTGDFAATAPGAFTGTAITGIQYINDIAIKNNGGVSEIYAAVGDSYNQGYVNSSTYGLYKSVDGGATWTGPLNLPVSPSGNKTCPFDIEIAVGGKIWVSSTDSTTFGDGGGKIFVSTDNGATWTLKHTIVGNGGGSRVEIEASNTTADVLYVCSELSQADTAAPTIEVQLLKTTNGFTTAPTVLPLPAGNETRETTYGFTGAQAFYDMMIETDPTNDAIVYVGGIDLYRSSDSGATWTGISNWQTDVHSDQHAMAFKPGNPNAGIFGNDGGVWYSGNLATTTASDRNFGFNVTQFVGVAVSPTGVTGLTGDFFVAGAQDNGSNYFPSTLSTTTGVTAGTVSGSAEVQGGDGGIPLFKQNATSAAASYYITNYVNNDNMNKRGLNGAVQKVLSNATQGRGMFYPAMTLDSTNDIVYSDFTDGTNRVYTVRRYSNYMGGPAPTRTDLTFPSLFNQYPTALRTGKVTPTTLYVGTLTSKLLKLTNANTVTAANSTAGVGWTDISVGSGFVGSISDIEFGATDNQIFVTLKNYGTTNVWYTPNGGTNWYSIEGNLPDMPVHTILQNPLNAAELMIGTELGVWYANTFNPAATSAQALNWVQSYNGMSGVKVTDLDLQPNSPTAPTAYNVFAATYGRGVFSGPLTNTILSVNENDVVAKSISVYPTVSNGNVTINADKSYGKTTLELFDITGKSVYSNSIELDTNADQVNFGTLSAGNYILKLSGNDFKTTKRLIIQ